MNKSLSFFLNPSPTPSLKAKGRGVTICILINLPFPCCLREGQGWVKVHSGKEWGEFMRVEMSCGLSDFT